LSEINAKVAFNKKFSAEVEKDNVRKLARLLLSQKHWFLGYKSKIGGIVPWAACPIKHGLEIYQVFLFFKTFVHYSQL